MMVQYLRKSTLTDLPEMLAIYAAAKQYLHQQQIDQWQDGYPDEESIKADIIQQRSYVLICDTRIAAVGVLATQGDPTYAAIDGQWCSSSHQAYVAVHRTAVSEQFRGQHLAQILMSSLMTIAYHDGFKDIRIDTHPDNLGMQHVIQKSGFDYRGIVWLNGDSGNNRNKRWAYQIVLP